MLAAFCDRHSPGMKTTVPPCGPRGVYPGGLDGGYAGIARFFDIVNGFLIDAVAHRIGSRTGADAALTDVESG